MKNGILKSAKIIDLRTSFFAKIRKKAQKNLKGTIFFGTTIFGITIVNKYHPSKNYKDKKILVYLFTTWVQRKKNVPEFPHRYFFNSLFILGFELLLLPLFLNQQ